MLRIGAIFIAVLYLGSRFDAQSAALAALVAMVLFQSINNRLRDCRELGDQTIEDNRIDLYLQPIVTLPQRKVRHYEARSHLRSEDGEIIPAGDFIEYAERAGLIPRLDNLPCSVACR